MGTQDDPYSSCYSPLHVVCRGSAILGGFQCTSLPVQHTSMSMSSVETRYHSIIVWMLVADTASAKLSLMASSFRGVWCDRCLLETTVIRPIQIDRISRWTMQTTPHQLLLCRVCTKWPGIGDAKTDLPEGSTRGEIWCLRLLSSYWAQVSARCIRICNWVRKIMGATPNPLPKGEGCASKVVNYRFSTELKRIDILSFNINRLLLSARLLGLAAWHGWLRLHSLILGFSSFFSSIGQLRGKDKSAFCYCMHTAT